MKSTSHKVINKTLWLIGTSRNAILVVICGVMGYYFQSTSHTNTTPFKIIGAIPEGLPTFQIPKFTLNANESTTGTPESFIQIVQGFGSGLIILPLITLMENIAICKAFCKIFHKTSLLNQCLNLFLFNSKRKTCRCITGTDCDRNC